MVRWRPGSHQVVDMSGGPDSLSENEDSGAAENAMLTRLETWFQDNQA